MRKISYVDSAYKLPAPRRSDLTNKQRTALRKELAKTVIKYIRAKKNG